jgi:uncharacterized repeat protein (TIGR01451 family)
MKHTGLKKFLAVVMTAVTLVVPVTALASYGPAGRPTLTYGPDFKGADHVQFNSIVNAPGYGDERAFFDGRDASLPTGSAWNDPVNNVQAGKEYRLRIMVHNNANQNLNASGKGVAEGVKVAVELPSQTAKSLQAKATISTTTATATPKSVYDTLDFKANSDVKLSYVPGSAYIKTNKLNNVKLSDSIVSGGATVGSEALDGKWLGCFAHSGWVYLTVKASAPVTPQQPGISIAKTVAKGDVTANTTTAAVAPSDKVAYGITVTNNSKADAKNVVVRDVMPAGVTVTGATLALNGAAPQAITNYQQLFSKDGINIGTVQAGKTAVIVVKATVNADATGKDCSINLLNTAYASATDVKETSASATLQVSKNCDTPPTLPAAGAESAAAAALGLTAIGSSAQAYLRSKRGLAKAQRKINR